MSVEIMGRVWRTSAQKGADLLVLLALADWANDRGECDPSYSQLAQKARVGRRWVMRIVQSLAQQGEIVVEAGKGFEFADGVVSNRIVLVGYLDGSGLQTTRGSGLQTTGGSGLQTTGGSGPQTTHNGQPQRSTATSTTTGNKRRAKSEPKTPAEPPSAPPSPWAPFYREALAIRRIEYTGGKLPAWVGHLAAAAGNASGSDPVQALELLREFLRDPKVIRDRSDGWLTDNGRLVNRFADWSATRPAGVGASVPPSHHAQSLAERFAVGVRVQIESEAFFVARPLTELELDDLSRLGSHNGGRGFAEYLPWVARLRAMTTTTGALQFAPPGAVFQPSPVRTAAA